MTHCTRVCQCNGRWRWSLVRVLPVDCRLVDQVNWRHEDHTVHTYKHTHTTPQPVTSQHQATLTHSQLLQRTHKLPTLKSTRRRDELNTRMIDANWVCTRCVCVCADDVVRQWSHGCCQRNWWQNIISLDSSARWLHFTARHGCTR